MGIEGRFRVLIENVEAGDTDAEGRLICEKPSLDSVHGVQYKVQAEDGTDLVVTAGFVDSLILTSAARILSESDIALRLIQKWINQEGLPAANDVELLAEAIGIHPDQMRLFFASRMPGYMRSRLNLKSVTVTAE